MTEPCTTEPFPKELQLLEQKSGSKFENLRTSSKEAATLISDFRKSIEKELGTITDTDVLLTGSIGRQEVTKDSDCDYLVISNSAPDHDLVVNIFRTVNKLVKEFELRANFLRR